MVNHLCTIISEREKNTRKAWEKSGINSETSNLCLLWIKLNQKHIEIRLYSYIRKIEKKRILYCFKIKPFRKEILQIINKIVIILFIFKHLFYRKLFFRKQKVKSDYTNIIKYYYIFFQNSKNHLLPLFHPASLKTNNLPKWWNG